MEQSNEHGLGESRRGSEVTKALSNQSTGTGKPHSAGQLVFSPLRTTVSGGLFVSIEATVKGYLRFADQSVSLLLRTT